MVVQPSSNVYFELFLKDKKFFIISGNPIEKEMGFNYFTIFIELTEIRLNASFRDSFVKQQNDFISYLNNNRMNVQAFQELVKDNPLQELNALF